MVDYLGLTRRMYRLTGVMGPGKRRIVTNLLVSSMFAFSLHAFCNGCLAAGLHHNCLSETVALIVIHAVCYFKMAVLYLRGGDGMAQVFSFVDGYIFVNDSYSKHIYVTSFWISSLTVLAYAAYPLVWSVLPFYYEAVWGSGYFIPFFSSYVLLFFDLCLILFASLLSDYTYLMCADAICFRLKNVKSKFESIESVRDEGKLILAIKEHQRILRILKYLSSVVSPSFFSQVLCTFVSVILGAYSAMNDNFQHFPSCICLFGSLLLYCWLGQMVRNATEDLYFAAYNNGWYKCNKKMKKNLEIVALFTREPFQIKGFSIFKMNLQTFKQVLTDSYSYLMLLMTMTDSK